MKKKKRFKLIEEREFYRKDKSRGTIKISELEDLKIKTVAFSKEYNKNGKWIPKKGKFFAISFRWIGEIIGILLDFAEKFQWNVKGLKKPEKKFRELRKNYDGALQKINELQITIKKLEENVKFYRQKLEELQVDIVKKNFDQFKSDIKDFKTLIEESEKRKVSENEVQSFLKNHPWMFSPEYYNVTPKKPVGSKDIFDFYLEDYKGQGTVVELKKPSDKIFSSKEEFGLSSVCGQAIGQLIRYIEDTISYSQIIRIREIKKIKENRPLGFLIIGRTKTQKEIENIKILNSYLHMIQILSYDMLLFRAKKFVEMWERKGEKNG